MDEKKDKEKQSGSVKEAILEALDELARDEAELEREANTHPPIRRLRRYDSCFGHGPRDRGKGL